MNRIATTERAPYRSRLREGQAAATRDRILQALLRVMARGVAELSIPAVAREAGVSVPTVYRHFGSKRRLLAELQPYFARYAGLDRVQPPRSLDEMEGLIRTLFGKIDALGPEVYAALASPLGGEARRIRMAERLQSNRAAADLLGQNLSADDRDRLARLMVVLASSASLRTWREYLGATVDQAADDVSWALRTMIAGASAALR